jgi:hypothetical protein
VKVNIRGRLVGGSSLWLFTRISGTSGQMEASKPICVIKKEVDTQRVFVIFGTLTDVSRLEKPNLMKASKPPTEVTQPTEPNSSVKDPVFSFAGSMQADGASSAIGKSYIDRQPDESAW